MTWASQCQNHGAVAHPIFWCQWGPIFLWSKLKPLHVSVSTSLQSSCHGLTITKNQNHYVAAAHTISCPASGSPVQWKTIQYSCFKLHKSLNAALNTLRSSHMQTFPKRTWKIRVVGIPADLSIYLLVVSSLSHPVRLSYVQLKRGIPSSPDCLHAMLNRKISAHDPPRSSSWSLVSKCSIHLLHVQLLGSEINTSLIYDRENPMTVI